LTSSANILTKVRKREIIHLMTELQLLSTSEAADYAGVSVATVTRWVHAGTLKPAGKVPGLRGAFMFTKEDVDALLAERKAS
jgi:excisionase family DNA binding protein